MNGRAASGMTKIRADGLVDSLEQLQSICCLLLKSLEENEDLAGTCMVLTHLAEQLEEQKAEAFKIALALEKISTEGSFEA